MDPLTKRKQPGKQVWHRLKEEPEDAFAAFSCFLFQVRPRRESDILIDGYYAKLEDVVLWKRKHFWKKRVEAFDEYIHDSYVEERERVLDATMRDLTYRHAQMLSTGFEYTLNETRKLLAQSKSTESPVAREGSVRQWIETVISKDRLNASLSTEKIEIGGDLSSLSKEELAALENIHLKLSQSKDGK